MGSDAGEELVVTAPNGRSDRLARWWVLDDVPMPKTRWEWITAIVLVTALPAALTISCGASFWLIAAGSPGTRLVDGLRTLFIGAGLGLVIGLVLAIRGLFRWTAEDQRFVLVCMGAIVATMLGIVMWVDRIGRW